MHWLLLWSLVQSDTFLLTHLDVPPSLKSPAHVLRCLLYFFRTSMSFLHLHVFIFININRCSSLNLFTTRYSSSYWRFSDSTRCPGSLSLTSISPIDTTVYIFLEPYTLWLSSSSVHIHSVWYPISSMWFRYHRLSGFELKDRDYECYSQKEFFYFIIFLIFCYITPVMISRIIYFYCLVIYLWNFT